MTAGAGFREEGVLFGPPDVSVVIPTRNRRELLLRAIRSCVDQGPLPDVEVIVVDDGCTDGSVEAVQSEFPQVVLLTDRPTGNRNRARNDGLSRARGRYVQFLDDDDWLEAGALRDEVRLADATGADIVAGGHRVAGPEVPEQVWMPPVFEPQIDCLLQGAAVPTGAALYRREAVISHRWEEQSHKLDDWRYFVQVAMCHPRVVRLERVVYTWYSHPGQGTRKETLLDNAKAFYEILDEVEGSLMDRDLLTHRRRLRLAQYRYKELRVLCLHDRDAFESEVLRILDLDPDFRPVDEEGQRWMRWLGRWIGFRRATLLHTWVKRRVKGSPGGPG